MIALFLYCSWEFLKLLRDNENVMGVLIKESVSMVPALLICLLLFFISMLLRAHRWSKLLAQPESLWLSYRAISIGYLVSCPLSKLGEVARISVFKRQNNTSLATLLSTVFIDRVMDFLALFIIILICFSTHSEVIQNHFPQLNQAVAPVTTILVTALLGSMFLLTKMSWMEQKIQQFNLSDKHKSMILSLLNKTRDGFQNCQGIQGIVYLILTTVVIWSTYLLIFWVICSFYPGTPDDYKLMDLWVIFFVGSIGSILPAPGGVAYPLFLKAGMDLTWVDMPDVDKTVLATLIFMVNFWALNLVLGGISTVFQLTQRKQVVPQIND